MEKTVNTNGTTYCDACTNGINTDVIMYAWRNYQRETL